MRARALPMRGGEESALRLVSAPAELAQAEILPILGDPDALSEYVPVLPDRHPYYRTLTIIVPIYNERNTVMTMLEKICLQDTVPLRKEIILVDD